MEATIEATMASLNVSQALLDACARQLGVKEKEGKATRMASFATLTLPLFVPVRAQEQPATKSSSSSTLSAYQVVAAGALHTYVALTTPTPTRCSTIGSTVSSGGNHSVVTFTTSDTKHLTATTWPDAVNNGLQGASWTDRKMPAGCSTFVLASPHEGSTASARAVNTDVPRCTSFPCFDGTNPRLWKTQCLEYFNRFNIHKCMWVIAAKMYMEGKAKVWYESHRLRQAVGDWSEFMDAMEENFGVCDFHQELQVHLFPSETAVVGVAHTIFNEIPNKQGDIAMVPVNASSVHRSMALAIVAISQKCPVMPERLGGNQVLDRLPGASDDKEKVHVKNNPGARTVEIDTDMSVVVLTHVGGFSLFQELEQDYADDVSNDIPLKELANCIVTHIGNSSLFLELVVESIDGILMTSNVNDVMCNEDPPYESEHEGTYMQKLMWCDASLGDLAHMVEPLAKECSHDVSTFVGSSFLFLEQVSNVADKLFDTLLLEDVSRYEAVSAYNRNSFDHGIVTASVECWVLEMSWPLQCHGFTPGSTIEKSKHQLYGSSRDPLSLPSDPRVLQLILCDTSVWKVTYSTTHEWDPGISPDILDVHLMGILQLFDSCVMGSALRQPVLLFESGSSDVPLTLPWDPGEHVYVENVQLYILAYKLLDTVGNIGSGIEISIHSYVVSGHSIRQWDPGVVAICKQDVFIPISAQFGQYLLNKTPPYNILLDLVCLSAKDIHDILMCLLLAAREGTKAWADQCIKPLNFREILRVEQAGYILGYVMHWLALDILGALCLKVLQFVFDKGAELKKDVHRILLQLVWKMKKTFPTREANWEQWESEHCKCVKKFMNPVHWPIGIFECVQAAELKVHICVVIGPGIRANMQLT